MSLVMRKPAFSLCEKTKAQISCLVCVAPSLKPGRQVFSQHGSYGHFLVFIFIANNPWLDKKN